jgi:DNA (cytosine-5)-methyltransferase 1
MKNMESTFSVLRFSKRNGSKEILMNECFDEEGNVISFIDQVAIVSHFLRLKDSSVELPYCSKAEIILNQWYKIKKGPFSNENNNNDYYVEEPSTGFQAYLFPEFFQFPFKCKNNPDFKFIDLFAGIGGFRIAMQDCGGECVYSSEWDEKARQTYFHNFGEVPFGDITRESNKQLIPNGFDVLCAGFPCQAFSIAGYRKGFEDTRGTLFFDVAEIIKRKRPKAVFLENVKNLYTHDNGKTFSVIKGTLEDLGYIVYHKVMNAMEYANVPQNRERIFIVCFDPLQVPNYSDFSFPEKEKLTHSIKDCLDSGVIDSKFFYTEKFSHYEELVRDMTSTDTIYQWRRQYVRGNKSNVCPTLTANMGTGGHNVPLILTEKGIRKLTPKECINFQGYPEAYTFPYSIADSAKYKQAGNSVVVPLIRKVCKNIVTTILNRS